MALTRRIGRFQPFASLNQRDDNRYQGLQLGVVSYASIEDTTDENYQVSMLELGGRSDHISDAFVSMCDGESNTLSTSSPLPNDVALMRSLDKK